MPSGVAYPQITFLIQEMAILCYPIIKKTGRGNVFEITSNTSYTKQTTGAEKCMKSMRLGCIVRSWYTEPM